MSNRAVRAVIAASEEDPNIAFLDPNQDAQVINYDNITAHLDGQQITFVTGSATLVPIIADESARDGFGEPIASSAEVLAASTLADCLAPMKEQPPRTPVHSPLKCGGFSLLRRSDSLLDPTNPYLQGCRGGRLDFGPDADESTLTTSDAAVAADSSAYADSVLGKRNLGGNSSSESASESSTKRFRSLEEAEKEFLELSRYAQQMEEQYLKCLNKDLALARANEELIRESSRKQRELEDVAQAVLYSVFECFPSGYDRAEWLRDNLYELRTLTEIVGLHDNFEILLEEEDIQSDDSDDDCTTDGGNSDAL
jgi:hypothetical protein